MLDRNLYSKGEPDGAEIICVCYYKSRDQIIKAIKENKLTTVLAIGETIRAGTNCGRCQIQMQEILETVNATEEQYGND